MTRSALPYRRPTPDLVATDAWLLLRGSAAREMPVYLDGWDYNTDLKLQRLVRVQTDDFVADAQLESDARLSLVVVAFSTATWIRRRIFSRPLSSPVSEVTIDALLAGQDMGGDLHLRTAIVLETRSRADRPFTSHLRGSVLWEDEHVMRLQGDAPLFPISVIDFERGRLPEAAGWHLEMSPDMHAPLHASIRLYLNKAVPSVLSAFANASEPSAGDKAILRAVHADVARVMVEHALNQDPIVEGAELDPDSIGFSLQLLVSRLFPEDNLESLRAHRIEHPADFGTKLLSRLKVFGD